jgi:PAS domain S-box-containing protein
LRESEERFRNMADHAPVMMWVTDQNGHCTYLNRSWYEFTGQTEAEAEGFGWLEAAHPDDKALAEKAFVDANAARAPFRIEYRLRREDGHYRWAIDTAAPRFGSEGNFLGYVGSVIDIDDRREIEDALRSSEDRLRLAAEATQIGIWDFDPASGQLDWDERVRAGFGLSPDAAVDYDIFLEGIHPEDRGRADAAVQRALAPDGPGNMDVEYRTVGIEDGRERWIAARGQAFFEQGQAARFVGTTVDISSRKADEVALARSSAELGEQARMLETLNRSANELAGQLDSGKLVQMVTDNGVALVGAQFGAFFYNVLDEAGESYMLYALSGARPDQFDFGMPRNTAVFHVTFSGEGVVRVPDITKDPRYGKMAPHFGMPEGHLPVRSYLAVPVVSASGEVIGGLFFGHEEPDRFDERHETLVTGIAAQAAIAMDNARLFEAAQKELTSRMRAEQELRLLNETLEHRVADEIERRSQAEEALRQAQKMETLGQLTGGVAHDFNNLLQIVSGNIGLIQRNIPEENAKLRRAADNAARGAERAAVLTQRLLAFSRRQPLAPKPIDPNKMVGGMSEILHRTLGETIAVETVLASGLWTVEVDPNQLENAILNLAINARDAMPARGKLTIETCNTHLDRSYVAANAEVLPGQYVCICVTDSGMGMDADTVGRAFEPFFTTKEVGKGTGLGLSMVYGFVKQSGGHLKIYSEPGEGTTVKIYLPRLLGEGPQAEAEIEEPAPEGGHNETVLVCEDDEDVRAYTVEVLRELGYRVLEAADGPAALRLIERREERIDLLFTDVVLPSGMTGAVLADHARKLRPELKVLFTTGYARNAIVHHGRLDPGVELITKPFSYADLAARVRDILDGQP